MMAQKGRNMQKEVIVMLCYKVTKGTEYFVSL
jgi:hypothetical protein